MFINLRDRDKQKHQCERETSVGCLRYAPGLGIEALKLGVCLTGNKSLKLLVRGTMLQPI